MKNRQMTLNKRAFALPYEGALLWILSLQRRDSHQGGAGVAR